ncbi:MAG: hypothetical protein K0S91_2860 [Nitrososphaeraceae archaeon]|jgi:hypothetical protein|nr:hypothetical protein [Nitrososphaeraceae archaeon]
MPITKQCYNDTAVKLFPINFFMLKIKMVKLHQLSRKYVKSELDICIRFSLWKHHILSAGSMGRVKYCSQLKQFPCIQSKIIQTGLFLT